MLRKVLFGVKVHIARMYCTTKYLQMASNCTRVGFFVVDVVVVVVVVSGKVLCWCAGYRRRNRGGGMSDYMSLYVLTSQP